MPKFEMMNSTPAPQAPTDLLASLVAQALQKAYGIEEDPAQILVQPTRPEFEGDFTVVVFKWVKQARSKPEAVGEALGAQIQALAPEVVGYNVVKGFLNLTLGDAYWARFLGEIPSNGTYGRAPAQSTGKTFMIEYSSPNTNKPLHLGHIRNILLGWSVSQLLEAVGHRVLKVNLVNDRGIHICKSMRAWQKFGQGETPDSSGTKGDHLIGKYYVRFDQAYREEVRELQAQGLSEEQAKAQAPILLEAQEMLRRWERHDPEVYSLWERMNQWVYDGFDQTYAMMGVHFDHIYYESKTYLLGKSIVEDGLRQGVLYRREDGSVWCDLTDQGLDQKLLLRADGTSVYMTQDLGTAVERFEQYALDRMVYVVGNEQEYHFQVLKILLSRLGYDFSDRIEHLSYGMVFLPEGKMKSREGTVVDADDLMASLIQIARETADTLGKLADLPPEKLASVHRAVGLAALKYFILKVDPMKNMTFDPSESIDFNGNTGPFIQYTHARACSILRRVGAHRTEFTPDSVQLTPHERHLVRLLSAFPATIQQAASEFSPALVANYLYELAKAFNQFYHECPIAREENLTSRNLRVRLTEVVVSVLRAGLNLLGIEAPEQM